jgi:hypothetical protein
MVRNPPRRVERVFPPEDVQIRSWPWLGELFELLIILKPTARVLMPAKIGVLYITNTDFKLARVVDWDEGVIEVLEGLIPPIRRRDEVLCVPLDVPCVVELTVPYGALTIYVC